VRAFYGDGVLRIVKLEAKSAAHEATWLRVTSTAASKAFPATDWAS
jgi:hypothetical protein